MFRSVQLYYPQNLKADSFINPQSFSADVKTKKLLKLFTLQSSRARGRNCFYRHSANMIAFLAFILAAFYISNAAAAVMPCTTNTAVPSDNPHDACERDRVDTRNYGGCVTLPIEFQNSPGWKQCDTFSTPAPGQLAFITTYTQPEHPNVYMTVQHSYYDVAAHNKLLGGASRHPVRPR